MKGFTLKFSLLGLLAIAVAGTPAMLRAQTTPATPAAPVLPALPNKIGKQPLPFRGKVKAVDNSAKTISLANETIQITSDTKILKLGKPATLADIAVGDNVAGSYKKEADGKLNAATLRIGPKPPAADNTKTNTP
jgi:Cu/Ag efflux protein CusF